MALPDTFHQTLRSTTPTVVLDTNATLANDAGELSAAISNDATTEEDFYGVFELETTFSVAPVDRSPVDLYIIQTVDGVNFEEAAGGATPTTPRRAPDYVFGVQNVTTLQRQMSPQLPLPPRDFKVLVVNRAGQTMALTWQLDMIMVRGIVRE